MKGQAGVDCKSRTMQFLIERRCRFTEGDRPLGVPSIVCWVFVEAVPAANPQCPAKLVWNIDTALPGKDERGNLFNITVQRDGHRPAVCEHMGRLIE